MIENERLDGMHDFDRLSFFRDPVEKTSRGGKILWQREKRAGARIHPLKVVQQPAIASFLMQMALHFVDLHNTPSGKDTELKQMQLRSARAGKVLLKS